MKALYQLGTQKGETTVAIASDVVTLVREGRTSQYEFVRSGDRVQLFSDGTVFDVSVAHAADGHFVVNVNGTLFSLGFVDERAAHNNSASHSTKGSGNISAAMPGRVVRLAVKEGDAVDMGDALLVLEAMKMENEIKSNVRGVVKKVLVTPGQSVEAGAALIQIAPETEEHVS